MSDLRKHLVEVFFNIGNAFNLAHFKIEKTKCDYYKSDKEALRSDWDTVGEALRSAMKEFDEQNKEDYQKCTKKFP